MRDVPVPSSRCGLADGLPGGVPRTLERWASEQGQVVKVLIKPVHVFNELDSTSCQSPLSSARLGSAQLGSGLSSADCSQEGLHGTSRVAASIVRLGGQLSGL